MSKTIIIITLILTLTCNNTTIPHFFTNPEILNKTVYTLGTLCIDSTFGMFIKVTGATPLSYLWYKNNIEIPDCNNDSLIFDTLNRFHVGQYHCVVSNRYGEDTSKIYSLTFINTDKNKPLITSITPPNNSILTDSLITITFKIIDESGILFLLINKDTLSCPDSLFSFTIALELGKNIIEIWAIDGSINKNTCYLPLTYTLNPNTIDTIPPIISSEKTTLITANSNITIKCRVIDNCGISSVLINNDTMFLKDSLYSLNMKLNQEENTFNIIATDMKNNQSTLKITVFHDTIIPFLSLLSPSKDSLTIGSNYIKVEVIAKDKYGIKSVSFSANNKIYPATPLNDSLFHGTITDLSENISTLISIIVTDSAGNMMIKDIIVKYDPLVEDLEPPQFEWQKGPKNGDRVTTASNKIKYKITDQGNIDSAYCRINNKHQTNLNPIGNDIYETIFTLDSFGINKISLYARDDLGNKDSIISNILFNTIPTNISNPKPGPGTINVENLGMGVKFSWSPASDEDGDQISYNLYYGLNRFFLDIKTGLKDTFQIIPNLIADTLYYWFIQTCTHLDTLRHPLPGDHHTFKTIDHPTIIKDFKDTTCSINNKITISVQAEDLDGIESYGWELGNNPMILTSTNTVTLQAPNTPGDYIIELTITDKRGNSKTDKTKLHVTNKKPFVSANIKGSSTLFQIGTVIALDGTAHDSDGIITKREWKIGNSDFTIMAEDPTLKIDICYPKCPCIYRVTDDDGNINSDTIIIQIGLKWEQLGNDDAIGGSILPPSIAVVNKIPYVAYLSNIDDGFMIKRYISNKWEVYGIISENPFDLSRIQIEAKEQNIIYTYCQNPFLYKAQVAKVTPSSWEEIKLFDTPWGSIKTDTDLFLVSTPVTFNTDILVIEKYNGSDWSDYGKYISLKKIDIAYSINCNNNIPYIAYGEISDNGTDVFIRKYNNGNWVPVGKSIYSSPNGAIPTFSFDFNKEGVPYICFTDPNNNNKPRSMIFKNDNWIPLGTDYISNQESRGIQCATDSLGYCYVTYIETSMNCGITVKRLSSNLIWEPLEKECFTYSASSNEESLDKMGICINGGKIFIAFLDPNKKIKVMQFK